MKVTIKDASGRVVRTIDRGACPSGRQSLGWDGKGENGTDLPAGTYSITIEAKASGGGTVGAESRIRGKVDGVEFTKDGAILRAGGYDLSPANIVRVG